MKRKLSNTGLILIKQFEGCRLKAYKPVKTEKYYTIGYGHYGADVTADMVITQEKADELLMCDCDKFVERVNKYMGKYNFNQNQFDALVSFAFNIGSIDKLTANGTRSIKTISNKILAYDYAGGKKLAGLTRRRKAEHELFNKVVLTNNELLQVAQEVIDGEWGNGAYRKTLLINAGYDYKEVQKEVNRLLKG